MVKARALDKRRRSIRNIRKITRTMELIATARFKKAMDRATAATAYTRRITQLVSDLAQTGLDVAHPLLQVHESTHRAILLVLTSNRGMCGGYNSSVVRVVQSRWAELNSSVPQVEAEVAGKRGINALKFRGIMAQQKYVHFEDRPRFDEVEVLANRYLDDYAARRLDRLEVAYTRFVTPSRQVAVVETLLPLGVLEGSDAPGEAPHEGKPPAEPAAGPMYEFLPSAESILEEVVPASFKVKLFKCFLDAAVSEQIARMVAMKMATDNAGELIRQLSMTYNRARQAQITSEIMEVIGGAEAMRD